MRRPWASASPIATSATSVFPAPVGAATITLFPSRIACAARAWNGNSVFPRHVHVPSTWDARCVADAAVDDGDAVPGPKSFGALESLGADAALEGLLGGRAGSVSSGTSEPGSREGSTTSIGRSYARRRGAGRALGRIGPS